MRNEELMKKWAPILEHNALPAISDSHREAVTATLLENTEASIREGSSLGNTGILSEAAPANFVGDMSDGANKVTGYDPVLISLVRRSMPNLVAYDIVGVQPMTGPTGLIFAMKSKYGSQTGGEALFDTIDGTHSGEAEVNAGQAALQPGQGNIAADGALSAFENPTGVSTTVAETQGNLSGNTENAVITNPIAEMAFTIDKVSVTAVSRMQ